jgi:copper chaperone NosL
MLQSGGGSAPAELSEPHQRTRRTPVSDSSVNATHTGAGSSAAPAGPRRLRRVSRMVLAGASLGLALLFLLPLWHIRLKAPQYPEGLGLYIAIRHIEGEHPQDLGSINNLNHYIGMKRITPEDIPELRYMPWLVLGLVGTGLAAAALGRRVPLYLWTGLLGTVALAGLADFYRWTYDYGHDLDPEAIIKIPGMSYQPPLLGTKQLLNFSATSWPASGGWILIAALLTALWLSVAEYREAR